MHWLFWGVHKQGFPRWRPPSTQVPNAQGTCGYTGNLASDSTGERVKQTSEHVSEHVSAHVIAQVATLYMHLHVHRSLTRSFWPVHFYGQLFPQSSPYRWTWAQIRPTFREKLALKIQRLILLGIVQLFRNQEATKQLRVFQPVSGRRACRISPLISDDL